ncbi:MAG: copper homeostasis protein CutC [Alistipes sp.]|jgi:copper homeostasis protein|nr:copper homeostasis protein CutC [Alistipes sp.]
MKTLETELCAYGIEAVRTAASEGVTRVELCAGPLEGGTTPSAATIELAREAANNPAGNNNSTELHIMIRPRGGDFLYSDDEFAQMRRDITIAKQAGADGVVFGLLTPDGDIDTTRAKELVELARPMECTFHRAFDVARDPMQALEDIIASGCRRILTSGQRATAPEGIEIIGQLTKAANGRIEIMAGSGVNPTNGRALAAAGIDALHFSASAVRQGGMRYRSPHVGFSSGCASNDHRLTFADPTFVRAMVAIARNADLIDN